jgi:hypothetical protein
VRQISISCGCGTAGYPWPSRRASSASRSWWRLATLGSSRPSGIIGKFGKTSFEACMFESAVDAEKWVCEP